MANEKKRPIEERIAALMGRSAFCDIREGIGGTRSPGFTDQDVAAALGMVATAKGKLACLVLETHYGSTLVHLLPLLRAWEDYAKVDAKNRDATVINRFSAELAIREFASIRYGTPQLSHYAYLLQSRRERLQERMADVTRWLNDIREEALRELRASVQPARIARLRAESERATRRAVTAS